MSNHQDPSWAAPVLFGVATLAALGFGTLARRVARGETSQQDRRAQRRVHEWRAPGATFVASATNPLGKWYAYLPASLLAARRLQQHGKHRGAVALLGSAVAAALVSRSLDRLLPHRGPPPGRRDPSAQSFPSGHALEASAVAVSNGYVLWREGEQPAWSFAPLGLGSLAAGAGKLLLERHWGSDVLGGYLAGIALGATCAGVYELAR